MGHVRHTPFGLSHLSQMTHGLPVVQYESGSLSSTVTFVTFRPLCTVRKCSVYPSQVLSNSVQFTLSKPPKIAPDPPTSTLLIRPLERSLNIPTGLGTGLTLSAILLRELRRIVIFRSSLRSLRGGPTPAATPWQTGQETKTPHAQMIPQAKNGFFCYNH